MAFLTKAFLHILRFLQKNQHVRINIWKTS